MKLLIDLSSVVWTCLSAGTDPEGVTVEFGDKLVTVNTAAYGYEFVVNSLKASLDKRNLTPMDMVLVVEGMNSKAPRLMIDKDYKQGRDRPVEAYQEFCKLRDEVVELFRNLGAIAVQQDNCESDDVLGWFAENTKEDLDIDSRDGDIAVLNGVNQHGARVTVSGGANEPGVNKYGLFHCKYISLYKAMVGDPGDKISGIKGFGKAKWLDFDREFGEEGMAEMVRLAELGNLEELALEATQNKMVGKLYEGRADFIRSYKLAKLHPEWVNHFKDPLQWMPGFVHGPITDGRLKAWGAQRRLVTASNWAEFKPWALREMAKRPWYGLDIETTTPDESDDWLAVQGAEDSVDVMGSTLTGMSLTFGSNMQFTCYVSVDHDETANVSKAELAAFLCEIKQQPVIHNTMFEGPVLFNEMGELLKVLGYEGFLPNWLDTKLEASYVDENNKLGLKNLSKRWFGYDQVDYLTTTTLEGPAGSIPRGRHVGTFQKEVAAGVWGEEDGAQVLITPAVFETWDRVRVKMRELTGQEVLAYACDDTQTCTGLHNFFKLFMELEGTYSVYQQVEISASYLHAQSFVSGVKLDLAKLQVLLAEDKVTYEEAKVTLDAYLVSQGWAGTVTPSYTEVTAANIKEAHLIVFGTELKTAVRTPSKLVYLLQQEDKAVFAAACSSPEKLTEIVSLYFTGEPTFNPGSPKQLQNLFYTVMGLPVRVTNKPTDNMRAAGLRVGTPKTDNLAIAYALKECTEEQAAVLKALRLMKMVETRRGLYYEPYPKFLHWKTGKVHSSHNQSATNTRRASTSKPNVQQLSKNEKIEGFSPRVRELFVPHKKNAVIVSLDFSSQEILLMAGWSRDPELVALFVGDNPKDMHAITGCGIFNAGIIGGPPLTYTEFVEILKDPEGSQYARAKACRALGKAVNFGSQYRIAAKKLSSMLFVTESEAQLMLDAKADAFPVAEEWSQAEMRRAKHEGVVETMLGARRHLGYALNSSDPIISGKAERQAISYRIQGSAAEQTKLAEGRMWDQRLVQKFDCEFIAPVHDECVFSVAVDDVFEFLPAAHACMVAKYANMDLPVKSSISIGRDFGGQKEIGNYPTREAITKGLLELGFNV